jgi:type III pantothenate kinase
MIPIALNSFISFDKNPDRVSNLVIDIGNTRVKWGVFEKDKLYQSGVEADGESPLNNADSFDKIIVSSVRKSDGFDFPPNKTLLFSRETRLPIRLDYNTIDTLGLDRIAGAVGVHQEFPGSNCLLIDAGSCITYDLITLDAVFRGGAIAPGLQMRLSAMHQFTGKLPKIKLEQSEATRYPARSTTDSMKTGVLDGMRHEIEGYISHLKKEFPDLHVILSGGDASYFESKIKAPIFVRPEIILTGLNRILLHNEIHA